ncbi:DUF4931 domain-containing protein [Telmatocola sphagniphila]|uniref:DUF4931 domain-containing protein n=1 Tax=Telmatocola sphagniphila TaxID=1123043 RepID=A0A8E6BAC5_9BACT|nr:DUF4931 domain-containing protein [Telmatocola sphagniphila]QVL34307.1 DUF4931 domain-containing protein [Telmatocola sphagniphila]
MESEPPRESEWRHDYLTDRKVIIAGNRSNRPGAYSQKMSFESIARCPFCHGNEADSPLQLHRARLKNSRTDWDVRVVTNLYPALEASSVKGYGRHEVVIEAASHTTQFAGLSPEQIFLVSQVWQERLKELSQVSGIKDILLFKNNGPAAGASLQHIHSQILAMDLVPASKKLELAQALAYWKANAGKNYFTHWREEETMVAHRVITDGSFFSFCPYASRAPYEICILPRRVQPFFTGVDPEELLELSVLLKDLLEALGRNLNDPDYNLVLHQSPVQAGVLPYYSWRLEIIPRLTVEAGFELGTGYAINSMPPELAAQQIREWLSNAQETKIPLV